MYENKAARKVHWILDQVGCGDEELLGWDSGEAPLDSVTFRGPDVLLAATDSNVVIFNYNSGETIVVPWEDLSEAQAYRLEEPLGVRAAFSSTF